MNFSENLVRWYSVAFNVPFFCSKVIRNDKVNRIDHQNDGDKWNKVKHSEEMSQNVTLYGVSDFGE
jgi:hypothetical protein